MGPSFILRRIENLHVDQGEFDWMLSPRRKSFVPESVSDELPTRSIPTPGGYGGSIGLSAGVNVGHPERLRESKRFGYEEVGGVRGKNLHGAVQVLNGVPRRRKFSGICIQQYKTDIP